LFIVVNEVPAQALSVNESSITIEFLKGLLGILVAYIVTSI
jgi:hypothetical protein